VKKSALGLGALIGLVAMLVLAVGVAQAATIRYVAPTGEDAGNDCATQATPCQTIAHAVAEATAGDTVKVAAGSYEESVNVDKSLTLLGAQAGVDARGRNLAGLEDAGETIVKNSAGSDLTLSAGSSTVDGFKFEDGAFHGSGVFIFGATDNVVRNDVFSQIPNGYGANGVLTGTTFRHNRIEDTMYGIESDLAPASDVSIDANKFVDIIEYSVNFIEGGSGDTVTGNEQTGKTFANFAVFFKTTGAEATGNHVSEAESSAVYLGGGNTGTLISGNTFTGNEASGVSVADEFGDGPNRSIEVVGNQLTDNLRGVRLTADSTAGVIEIHSNRISGNSIAGVINEGEGALDASANWWGCDAGPNQSGCDAAVGPVDFDHWLVLTLSASPSQIYKTVGSSQLTASLTRDTAGEVVGEGPGSTPIAFATTLGSIGGAEPTLDGGRATAQLAAPSSTGTADVTASLDGETVHAAVKVIEAPEGPKGEPGQKGEEGDKGEKGEPGAKGATGEPGSPGAAGEKGATGETGATGATGSTGATGAAGAKGERGEKGEAGSSASNESIALKRKMSLKFLGGKAKLSGGDALVKVRCLGTETTRCVGTLALKVNGTSAKAAYSVAAGKTATVKVPLASEEPTTSGTSGAVSAVARTVEVSGAAVVTKHTLHLG
jgi:Collagen triple helix repeat (20 copies)/Right handed beta helix region